MLELKLSVLEKETPDATFTNVDQLYPIMDN